MESEECPAWRVVVVNLSGELCRVDLENEDATTFDLKQRVSVSLSMPTVEFDLIAPDARRMKPRDELSHYMLLGSDPTVTFAKVSSRSCSTCGARSGVFDRKPKLRACRLCLDVFYCNRACAYADFEKHSPECHTGRVVAYQARGRTIHRHDLR